MKIEIYRSIEIEMNACNIDTKKVKFILVASKIWSFYISSCVFYVNVGFNYSTRHLMYII